MTTSSVDGDLEPPGHDEHELHVGWVARYCSSPLPPPGAMSPTRIACIRRSWAGVSRYSDTLLPPKLIVGPAHRPGPPSPFDGLERASRPRRRARRTAGSARRPRRWPGPAPAWTGTPWSGRLFSATSAIGLRAASRAARSWAPTRASSMKTSVLSQETRVDYQGNSSPTISGHRQALCGRGPNDDSQRDAGLPQAGSGSGLIGQIEVHSIDWIPDTERHGKVWHQAPLWFLGNFQYFTIPMASSGRRSVCRWRGRLAGAAGILVAPASWPCTRPRGRHSGCRR